MINKSHQIEINQFLTTGKTARKIMFVPTSWGSVVVLPESAPIYPGDISPRLPYTTVKLGTWQHKSGEYVYIGLSNVHDTIVCSENFRRIVKDGLSAYYD